MLPRTHQRAETGKTGRMKAQRLLQQAAALFSRLHFVDRLLKGILTSVSNAAAQMELA